MEKRYQIFVSSTYTDLLEERSLVIQTIMKMDCIPAGMELFPAIDEEQFLFIKKIIDDCDYYVVIIGGRYGSTTKEGLSYTEKEYDYAVKKGLKVIAFVHKDPLAIPLGKSDIDPDLRAKLQAFRKKVQSGRLVSFWETSKELAGAVALSLMQTVKLYPAVGWVRASQTASQEALGDLNKLRKQNEALKKRTRELEARLKILEEPAPDLAAFADQLIIKGVTHSDIRARTKPKQAQTSGLREFFSVTTEPFQSIYEVGRETFPWVLTIPLGDVFRIIAPLLLTNPTDERVKNDFSKSLCKRAPKPAWEAEIETCEVDDEAFQAVKVKLLALKVIKVDYASSSAGFPALFWSLTNRGHSFMLEQAT